MQPDRKEGGKAYETYHLSLVFLTVFWSASAFAEIKSCEELKPELKQS